MMKILSTLCLAISLLLLSACSNLRVEQTTAEDNLSLGNIGARSTKELSSWQLSGKLGIRSTKSATSANLQWHQNKQHYILKLSGPLGTGTVTAQGNQEAIEVKQGSKTYAGIPQTIGKQLLGIPIPIHAISWWSRGLPSPELHSPLNIYTDSEGKISQFKQAGWELSFDRYQITQGYLLPTKLSGQFGDLRFKLIVSNWIITND